MNSKKNLKTQWPFEPFPHWVRAYEWSVAGKITAQRSVPLKELPLCFAYYDFRSTHVLWSAVGYATVFPSVLAGTATVCCRCVRNLQGRRQVKMWGGHEPAGCCCRAA